MFSHKSNGWFDCWLELCFQSIIRTTFLPKSESIIFIGPADPLKFLLKSAIRRRFLAKSTDTQTLSLPLLYIYYLICLQNKLLVTNSERINVSILTANFNFLAMSPLIDIFSNVTPLPSLDDVLTNDVFPVLGLFDWA